VGEGEMVLERRLNEVDGALKKECVAMNE